MRRYEIPTALDQSVREDKLAANTLKGYHVDFEAGLFRDRKTGEIRLAIRIPRFENLRLPDDLPVLIRTFAWVTSGIVLDAGFLTLDDWSVCCEINNKASFAAGSD